MKMANIFAIVASILVVCAVIFVRRWQNSTPVDSVKETSIYDFTVKDIKGQDFAMSQFKGKTVLVVNTASNCGLTPQYEGLEALYEKYKDRGFVVIGFPANNFMGQEPGSNEEIATFCSTKFKVSFPMMSKISVKGEGADPLYKFLIKDSGEIRDIEWNFAKFLVGKDGKVIKRYSPKTSPDDAAILKEIETAIKLI